MPIGHLNEQNQYTGKLQRIITLLESQVATTDGTWQALLGIRPFCFQIEGISGDTAELRFSCAPQKPADSAHGGLFSTLTSDVSQIFDAPVRWVKVRKTVGTSPITAYLYAG